MSQETDPDITEQRRVALTGSSGLIGQRLAAFLTARGDRVDPIVRRAVRAGTTEIEWHPAEGRIELDRLAGVHAVIHLAGENIAGGRWTKARKAAIRHSRIASTRLLSEALGKLSSPPEVLISASAIGFYGDRGDAFLDEQSEAGEGFLPEVCQHWETATDPARQAGIRVVNMRMGLVLCGEGGALARMLTPFKLGLGGVVGSGRQYMSWIAMADLLACIAFLMSAQDTAGPVNAVSPQPVTNAEFTRTLGRAVHRPTLAPVPAFAVRLLFGEMGETLLLSSARVLPRRLETAGFEHAYPTLEAALAHELGRNGGDAHAPAGR